MTDEDVQAIEKTLARLKEHGARLAEIKTKTEHQIWETDNMMMELIALLPTENKRRYGIQ